MNKLSLTVCVISLVVAPGCSNWIKQANTVILDRVPNTERVSLEHEQILGAELRARVLFKCSMRQFAVTNDYITPYRASFEFYEVPVGLVTFPFTFLWYVTTKLVSLGAAESSGSVGPLNWSVAGFNPLLPVENGMFSERYVIREKTGSRRPQEGSSEQPYSAHVEPMAGRLRAKFDGGSWIELEVGKEDLLKINLIELVHAMPGPESQKIILELKIQWNRERDPVTKTVTVFVDKPLASKLYGLRDASKTLMTTSDAKAFAAALKAVEDAGFSREAAMVRDRRQPALGKP